MEVSENVEEYLEALWLSEEAGEPLARITWTAQRIGVSAPSTVEMLKKLEERGYVTYTPRRGVKLSEKGRAIARQIIRNHRLTELLMRETLGVNVDEGTVCGIEHHMTEEFADALCTLLKHPERCPHGNKIPTGKCCKGNR
ncbi:MAG: metal-dependent transcriptional regulator [Candidatus Bathyarchaeia archaeon]